METAIKRVARLRLQPVLPLCERAVGKLKEIYPDANQLCIKVINTNEDIHVWVDDELFVEALVYMLFDLYVCLGSKKNITVFIGRVGAATFRLLVSGAMDLNLNSCEGPFPVTHCKRHKKELENVLNIVKTHGGSMHIWHRPQISDCIIEVNLICLNRDYSSCLKG